MDSQKTRSPIMSNITLSYATSGNPGTLTIPPSCKCSAQHHRPNRRRDNENQEGHCNQYECSCYCDLNKNKCDFNCCCDLDCKDDEKKLMFTKDCNDDDLSLLSEEENWVEMCYDRSQFEDVNIRIESGPIEVSKTSNYECLKNNMFFVKLNDIS